MLTELPRVFKELGWGSLDVSDYDLNRLLSSILLCFCIVLLLLMRTIRLPSLVQKTIGVISVCFVLSIALAIHTFKMVGMPFTGIFVVSSRYIIEFILFVFVYNFIQDEGDTRIIATYFFKVSLAIILGVTFFQIFTSSFGEVQGIERLMGTFGSPNILAAFLHLYIFLLLYYSRKTTLLFWSILGALYVLIVYTGSITNLSGNLLFIALVSIHNRWYKKKMFYLLVPIFVFTVTVAVMYKWESISARLSTLLDLNTFELAPASSISWRFEAWQNYISLLGDDVINWLIGLGIGTQRFIFLFGYPENLTDQFEAPGTHNDYLAVLVDFGLIGLAVFLGFLIIVYKRIKKLEKTDAGGFYFRYYFFSLLFIMVTENCIDQLITFVFLITLTCVIKKQSFHYEEKNSG